MQPLPAAWKYSLALSLTCMAIDRDHQLIDACEVANQNSEVTLIEQEFDALPDKPEEPCNDNSGEVGT
jgi:hypothetical protein